MKHGKAIIQESSKLIDSARRAGIPAFHDNKFCLNDRAKIEDLITMANRHCSIQTRYCSEEMSASTLKLCEAKEAGLERRMSAIAAHFGLTADFSGDPRGFTTKLKAPADSLWNTWGGRETGYGIGESR